jgi:hypothetical protein
MTHKDTSYRPSTKLGVSVSEESLAPFHGARTTFVATAPESEGSPTSLSMTPRGARAIPDWTVWHHARAYGAL